MEALSEIAADHDETAFPEMRDFFANCHRTFVEDPVIREMRRHLMRLEGVVGGGPKLVDRMDFDAHIDHAGAPVKVSRTWCTRVENRAIGWPAASVTVVVSGNGPSTTSVETVVTVSPASFDTIPIPATAGNTIGCR